MQIERTLSDNEYEVFSFTQFDSDFVLTQYCKFEKQGRKNPKLLAKWDNYFQRGCTIPQPEMDDEIKQLALEQAKSLVKIKTWKEFKRI